MVGGEGGDGIWFNPEASKALYSRQCTLRVTTHVLAFDSFVNHGGPWIRYTSTCTALGEIQSDLENLLLCSVGLFAGE